MGKRKGPINLPGKRSTDGKEKENDTHYESTWGRDTRESDKREKIVLFNRRLRDTSHRGKGEKLNIAKGPCPYAEGRQGRKKDGLTPYTYSIEAYPVGWDETSYGEGLRSLLGGKTKHREKKGTNTKTQRKGKEERGKERG